MNATGRSETPQRTLHSHQTDNTSVGPWNLVTQRLLHQKRRGASALKVRSIEGRSAVTAQSQPRLLGCACCLDACLSKGSMIISFGYRKTSFHEISSQAVCCCKIPQPKPMAVGQKDNVIFNPHQVCRWRFSTSKPYTKVN